MEFPRSEEVLRKLGLAPGPGPVRLKPRLPRTAVQIAAQGVSAVRLVPRKARKGGDSRPILAAYQEAGLPEGAVDPSLTGPNVPDPAPVGRTIEGVLEQVAPGEARISVVIPDSAARVSILKFNRMPATRKEALDLVRFRLQKVLPFRVEEAALDCHLLSELTSPEPDFLVALIQRPILWQYERLIMGRDRIPGLVDLESFNVANLARLARDGRESDAGDQAVINAAGGYLTALVFRNGTLIFYRCKAYGQEERRLNDRLLLAIRRELASCAAFYREHLSGAGLVHAVVRAVVGDPQAVLAVVQEELTCPARLLDPGRAVVLPEGATPADPLWQRLAPSLGAALGRRA